MALPTTQPSAADATALACAGFEMPKPTATGRFVCARIFAGVSFVSDGRQERSLGLMCKQKTGGKLIPPVMIK